MKIAVVVKRLSTLGGTERFAHGFVRWAVGEGHTVDVWCAAVDHPVAGVSVLPLLAGGRGRMWRMWSMCRAAARVPVDSYDTVLSLVRGPVDGVYRAGGGCHRAWVEAMGWSLADVLAVRVDRAAVARARLVVVNSDMARSELQRWYGVDAARLRLVQNGVDLQRFRPDPAAMLPVSGPAVVFFGSGFARKGLDIAIRAVARIPGLHLVVMGSDRRVRAHERVASRLGASDRIHFLGEVEHPEALLPAAKAMILPTQYDPFANACLEAMACGVPVVTTLSNGAAEILPNPWMAVDRTTETDGWVRVLQRVLDDPGLGAAARAVAEGHSAEAAYRSLMNVLLEARQ